MEPLWLKIMISSAGAFVILTGGWIRYMNSKLADIVARKDIADMINLQIRPGEVRTKLMKEKLDRIEAKLDALMELLFEAEQKRNSRKGQG